MIRRKKKICVKCGKEKYIFSKGRCKLCSQKSYSKPKAKKKYISPISKGQSERLSVYRKKRDRFMEANPKCAVCGGESTDLHHMKGRVGKNLTDTSNFLAVCRPCHNKIEENPEWAKQNGYSKNRL